MAYAVSRNGGFLTRLTEDELHDKARVAVGMAFTYKKQDAKRGIYADQIEKYRDRFSRILSEILSR